MKKLGVVLAVLSALLIGIGIICLVLDVDGARAQTEATQPAPAQMETQGRSAALFPARPCRYSASSCGVLSRVMGILYS